MKFAALLVFALLAGCNNGTVTLSKEESERVDRTTKLRGDERVKMFRECMELAAKMPRQADDDVADVVEQCQSSSYYLTNYLEAK